MGSCKYCCGRVPEHIDLSAGHSQLPCVLLDTHLKFCVCPAGCVGPGYGFGPCWVHRTHRVIWAIPPPSHHTHVKTENGALAPHLDLWMRAPRGGGKREWGCEWGTKLSAGEAAGTSSHKTEGKHPEGAPGTGPLTPGKSSHSWLRAPHDCPQTQLCMHAHSATLACTWAAWTWRGSACMSQAPQPNPGFRSTVQLYCNWLFAWPSGPQFSHL